METPRGSHNTFYLCNCYNVPLFTTLPPFGPLTVPCLFRRLVRTSGPCQRTSSTTNSSIVDLFLYSDTHIHTRVRTDRIVLSVPSVVLISCLFPRFSRNQIRFSRYRQTIGISSFGIHHSQLSRPPVCPPREHSTVSLQK